MERGEKKISVAIILVFLQHANKAAVMIKT
jgi:hypothetical protein